MLMLFELVVQVAFDSSFCDLFVCSGFASLCDVPFSSHAPAVQGPPIKHMPFFLLFDFLKLLYF